MRTTPDILVNAVTMGADIASASQQLDQMFGYSMQCVWTNSPVGTLKLQGSLDNSHWDDVPDSSFDTTGVNSHSYNVADVNYPYVRIIYTRTSGTGSLTVNFFGRGF